MVLEGAFIKWTVVFAAAYYINYLALTVLFSIFVIPFLCNVWHIMSDTYCIDSNFCNPCPICIVYWMLCVLDCIILHFIVSLETQKLGL